MSQNSNSAAVSTTVNNNNLVLNGVSVGGSTITVCQSGNQCGTVNVYVNPSSSSVLAPAAVSGSVSSSVAVASVVPPTLFSVTISTNGTNNSFIGTGAILTLNFNVNQSVNNVKVSVSGTQLSSNGSGSGPYTVSYQMTGNEAVPLPVSINFTNLSGQPGQAYFWISNYASASPAPISAATPVAATAASCPSGYSCTANSSQTASAVSSGSSSGGAYSFDNYLYVGMTKIGVANPDVSALQKRLKADGVYSGPITGYFGPLTKTAVEAYQTKHGLSPIGVVGPSTRNLLNEGI